MKTKISTLVLMIVPLIAFSQVKKIQVEVEKNAFNIVEEVSLKGQFLDSAFYGGKVVFKTGETSRNLFNYNMLNNNIFFLDEKGQALQLTGLKDISAIFYGKRTFFPLNAREVVELVETFPDGSILAVKRKTEIKNKVEQRGAYGSSTVTSATVRVTAIDDVRPTTINLDKTTEIEILLHLQYYVINNNKIFALKKLKDLKRIYPTKWEMILQHVRENNLKLENKDHIIALINFCAS